MKPRRNPKILIIDAEIGIKLLQCIQKISIDGDKQNARLDCIP